MKAYTNGITKEQFVNEIKRHIRLDHFIKGSYSEGVYGCAVGCSIKSINRLKGTKLSVSSHKQYEEYLGIPEWLAKLEDRLFEELPEERSVLWPLEFSEAINERANLNTIKTPFLIFILEQVVQYNKSAVQPVIDALKSGDAGGLRHTTIEAARAAGAAGAAAEAARAAGAAGAAAEAAAEAARAAGAAGAAAEAAGAAEAAAYTLYADKLLELMRECK